MPPTTPAPTPPTTATPTPADPCGRISELEAEVKCLRAAAELSALASQDTLKVLQRYIGANARYRIEIGILEDILAGAQDFSPSDMEYWGPMHDKARDLRQRIAALASQVSGMLLERQYLQGEVRKQEAVIKQASEALWVCAEHNELYHGSLHNTVIEARSVLRAIEDLAHG